MAPKMTAADEALARFKQEAANLVDEHYAKMAADTKAFDVLVKRHKTSADGHVEADTENFATLKQLMSRAKSSIKETHRVEQAVVNEIGVSTPPTSFHQCLPMRPALSRALHMDALPTETSCLSEIKQIHQKASRRLDAITPEELPGDDQQLGLSPGD
jgi:hypothetical protein